MQAKYDPDDNVRFDCVDCRGCLSLRPDFDPASHISRIGTLHANRLRKATARSLSSNRQATQAEINAAQKTLIDSAEYFMYSFIP